MPSKRFDDSDDQGEINRLRDEVEQLRTALENADEEMIHVVEHRNRLLARVASQARDLHAVNASYASVRKDLADADGKTGAQWEVRAQEQEELRVAFEELQVVTEELEVANTNLRLSNQELDARVEERTQKIRESEARFRGLVEGFAQAVWETDSEGVVVADSPSWRAFTGQTRNQWLGKGWLDAVHPDDRLQADAQWRDAIRARRVVDMEFRLKRAAGGWAWSNVRAAPISNDAGAPLKWAAMSIDITARRLAEVQLRASEERLTLALSVGGLGAWDWDMRSGMLSWSDEHYWMLGYRVGEVRPSYDAWIARVHPEDREETVAVLDQAREAHLEYSHGFRVVWPDGVERVCQGRGVFYYDESGAAVRMIGVMQDVTDERESSDRLSVLVAELQHRTRNLLTVVQSIADRTLQGSASLDDFRQRFLTRINALARVQGLLSRLHDGDRITFDELLDAELSALGHMDQTGRIALEGPKGVRLRSSTVQTFALALHELATNALKHGALAAPQGRLAVSWRREDGDDDRLYVEWVESGVPLSPDAAHHGRGYGRELIERALPYQLKAKTTYELTSDGVRCSISLPISRKGAGPS